MAQVDYFLDIDSVDGESKDDAFTDCIDVQSWSWGESNTGAFGSGTTGGTAGKVSPQDFHFVMPMNKATAKLLLACATGKHFTNATLTCRKAGESPQVYMKLVLTDVVVSSYQTGGSASGDVVPTDQVSLNFAKLEYAYGAQDGTGKVASLDQKAGYNFQTNKVV
jgi:type VI secretion system secreted protein Hcp